MSEAKIFCSVIIFILGIYTIVLLQYELFTLNNLNTSTTTSASGGAQKHRSNSGSKDAVSIEHKKQARPSLAACNSTMRKSKFSLDRLNCGSAGELLDLVIQNCTDKLPCDIQHNVNYSVVLHFKPSRNVTMLEIHTSVRQKKDLKYLHQETMHVAAREGEKTTLKFSFLLPPHPIFKPKKKKLKCIPPGLFFLRVEIWDVDSGIGEMCLTFPMLVYF